VPVFNARAKQLLCRRNKRGKIDFRGWFLVMIAIQNCPLYDLCNIIDLLRIILLTKTKRGINVSKN